MRAQLVVEVIEHHARLHLGPAGIGGDRDQPVHIAAHVEDDAVVEALAIGARATTARGHRDAGKGGVFEHAHQPHHIRRIARGKHQIGGDAIDRIVRRHGGAQGAVVVDIAKKPRVAQGFGQGVQRIGRGLGLRHLGGLSFGGILTAAATSLK